VLLAQQRCILWLWLGGTENAGPENAGLENAGLEIVGLENVGLENRLRLKQMIRHTS